VAGEFMGSWSRGEEAESARRTPLASLSTRIRVAASGDSDLLAGLADDEVEAIERSSTSQGIPRGRSLYTEGAEITNLYVVRSGSFKLVRHSEEGKELIVSLVGTGGWFGALDGPLESSVLARALEDSVVTVVPTVSLRRAMERSPELARRFLRRLEERLRSAEIQSARLAFESVARRLASLLVETTDLQSGLLLFPLNQTEIANLIGSSRETVCSLLNQFRRDRLVDIPRGRIQIVDREGLQAVR
jgi:CRP/FNR family transcriptional regulator, cyclic AMP receptor protein